MGLLDLFKKKGSSDVAKDRLKLLLVSDRANCSPEVMEMIKNDIIKVISKYMEIDTDGLDIQITHRPPVFPPDPSYRVPDVPSDNRSCVMHQNHHNPYREIPLQWDEMLSAHNASV